MPAKYPKQYFARLRRINKRIGFCIKCRDGVTDKGFAMCRECLDVQNIKRRAQRKEKHK